MLGNVVMNTENGNNGMPMVKRAVTMGNFDGCHMGHQALSAR